MDGTTIPPDIALALCEEARAMNTRKRVSFKNIMCWGCTRFSKSPQARCWSGSGDGTNRGCFQVNELFDEARRKS
nr:hypothetical protein [Candidatus Sigynarchaeum springense]